MEAYNPVSLRRVGVLVDVKTILPFQKTEHSTAVLA